PRGSRPRRVSSPSGTRCPTSSTTASSRSLQARTRWRVLRRAAERTVDPTLERRTRIELGFGLRPEQAMAVDAVLDDGDALVVMPTGAGKSAIYQAAGGGRPGCTLVVSPLLALHADQVQSIGDAFGGAIALNSLQGAG